MLPSLSFASLRVGMQRWPLQRQTAMLVTWLSSSSEQPHHCSIPVLCLLAALHPLLHRRRPLQPPSFRLHRYIPWHMTNRNEHARPSIFSLEYRCPFLASSPPILS